MLGRLVTLESFDNAMQAHLVKNHLAAAGVRCVLADEVSVTMYWHLSNAIGGIKLQVAEEDLERAEQILDALEQSHRSNEADPTDDVKATPTDDAVAPEPKPNADPDDVEEPQLNVREELIERAYKAVLVGLVLFPVQLYATWLLLSVWQEELPIRPALMRKLHWAIGLNVPLAVIAFFATGLWFTGVRYGLMGY